MLNRTAKTEREGRTRRAAGIEKYNSNVDRRTSQNGPLIFSAFIAVVVFSCVFVGGFALMGEFNVWWLLGALVVAWAATMCVHIAMQWEKVVIFRFGKFDRMAGPGLYFTIPFIEQTALKADQRIMVTGFGAEETLTSDLVPINVDAVLFWMVWDAKKACLEVENYYNSVSLAAQTALRDAIGRASVSEVAIRRNQLDQELQEVIEERTSVWGITVMSVEIRDIVIPQELQEAMSAEAQAEREKNARMVLAEVEKDISSMLVDAANVYDENELAVRLRTMHLLYESVKNSGGTVVIPSAYSEGFADAGLDREVFALASTLPAAQRVGRHETKIALRAAAARMLPQATAAMPKQGFITPLAQWLREEPWNAQVREVLNSERARRLFHTERLNALLDEHQRSACSHMKKIWSAYCFLIWHEQYFG